MYVFEMYIQINLKMKQYKNHSKYSKQTYFINEQQITLVFNCDNSDKRSILYKNETSIQN